MKKINMQERKLLKIEQVASLLGITTRTIRYYDQMELLPNVKRNLGRNRLFDKADIELIKKIRRIQNEEGLKLIEIKERLFGNKINEDKSDKVILSDSSIAISPEAQKQFNIFTIPLKIKIGNEVFIDHKLTPKLLKEKTANFNIQPEVIIPTEEEFERKYLELHELGYKEIYSIHLSSTLSDTLENAQKAADRVSDKINVIPIDSKSAGPGHRAFVMEIAELIKKKASSPEIERTIAQLIPLNYVLMCSNSISHMFNKMDTTKLDFKQKNILYKLFGFKPVMDIKGTNGIIDILAWHKEKDAAVQMILDLIIEEIKIRGGYVKRIYIDYNYLYAEANTIMNELNKLYGKAEIEVKEGNSFFSTFLGPEIISVSIN